MASEQFEFAISQYADGTLGEAERAALEARLRTDTEAMALLEEERVLSAALRQLPLPAVQWDRLAEAISAAVDRAEAPAQSYRLSRWRLAMPLSAAASVLLAAGVALHVYFSAAGPVKPSQSPVPQPAPQQVAIVSGPRADAPSGDVKVEVSIGPGKALAGAPDVSLYADDVVTRPSRVLVASGVRSVEDAPSFPY